MNNKLINIIKKLVEKEVDFVICGGLACILQGCDRSTYDLDLNIALSEENLQKAINVFKDMNFIPRIPEPIERILDKNQREVWVNEKNALVFTIISDIGDIQIDIFLKYPINYKELKNNADTFTVEDFEISVSSKQDLIKAKKIIFPIRDKDIYDIKQLGDLLNNDK